MKKRLIFSLVIALLLVATLTLPAVAEEGSVTATVNVGEIVNITISGSIAFGNVTPPVTDQGATGQLNDSTPAINIKVESDTNVNVDIGVKGAPLSGSLALANWKYSKTFGGTKTPIPSAYGTAVYTASIPGSDNPFFHWITVPTGTTSGDHSITVSYKAVKTGGGF